MNYYNSIHFLYASQRRRKVQLFAPEREEERAHVPNLKGVAGQIEIQHL